MKVSVRRHAVARTNMSMWMRVRVYSRDVGLRFGAQEGVELVAGWGMSLVVGEDSCHGETLETLGAQYRRSQTPQECSVNSL